jgi:hypothetical protein
MLKRMRNLLTRTERVLGERRRVGWASSKRNADWRAEGAAGSGASNERSLSVIHYSCAPMQEGRFRCELAGGGIPGIWTPVG